MSAGGHAERSHAKLSASGSKRWLTCTLSPSMEEAFEDTTSSFAEEGTAAHELSEIHLAYHLTHMKPLERKEAIAKLAEGPYYSQTMEDYVHEYVTVVLNRVAEARKGGKEVEVLLEQRLDFSEWVPDGFGTGDVLILSDGVLDVIDLKYGKGVPVSAIGNTQMRLYGLGAYNTYGILYDIERVRMTIVQPRLDSVSTEELTLDELLEWGNEYVKPRAEMAASGEGEVVPGDHCQFCKARNICKPRADKNLELAKYEFADPNIMTNEDIADVLGRVPDLVKWATEIKEYALKQALSGDEFPGFKVVDGRSSRQITDKGELQMRLLNAGYGMEAIAPREMVSMTALENMTGKKKFSIISDGLIKVSSGKPALVPNSDPRPAKNSVADAIKDFE